MQQILTTSQFAIYDEVLAADEFQRLLAQIESEDYVHVHSGGIKDVWRPEDGMPLVRNKPLVWLSTPLSVLLPRGAPYLQSGQRADFYPTQTPMDALFAKVKARALEHADLLGTADTWPAMAAKIYVYPVGTGLSWHDDVGSYAGSFIFYAHPQWSTQWGGELLIADPESAQALRERLQSERGAGSRRQRKHHFGFRDEYDEAVMKRGLGQFVLPKPNRLVLLSGGQPHLLARISPAAGNHCRISIAGFFLTAVGVSGLLQSLCRPDPT